MKTFEQILEERPTMALTVDIYLAEAIFELGQSTPQQYLENTTHEGEKMKTFEQLWEERPAMASLVDKDVARSIFKLGQQNPPKKRTICDKMLMGIEQDRLRKEARKNK